MSGAGALVSVMSVTESDDEASGREQPGLRNISVRAMAGGMSRRFDAGDARNNRIAFIDGMRDTGDAATPKQTMKTSNSPTGDACATDKSGGGVLAALILAAVTLACLCPFLGKAFHIDDPLFIWCGKHIVSEPGNFYHFNVNWEGREEPMAAATQNPPLASYYLALVGLLFGWSELALHAGFLVPALALVLGTYRLARRFCAHPLAAGLVTVTAPVFLVSSTNVMCDTMMVALWTWALVFWTEGLANNSAVKFWISAMLIAACGLTKYFGFALVPLLLAYSWMERRKFGEWAAYLLVPMAILAAYEWLTHKLYGRGALSDAFGFAQGQGAGGNLPGRILVGLAFSGGSIILLLAAAPLLWGRRALAAGCGAVILFGVYLVVRGKVGHVSTLESGHVNWLFVIQDALFTAAGAILFILAAADLLQWKSAESVFLLLWVAGTFAFACVACWQMSGRYLLPMLPAAAILLVRRLEFRKSLHTGNQIGPLLVPFGISLAIALMAAWADFMLANSARTAALSFQKNVSPASHAVWFEGHWGFQYYMELQGARAVDFWHMPFVTNDAVILPFENANVPMPPKPGLKPWMEYDCDTSKWLTTMSLACGAGFYSDVWGPLPYAFGHVPQARYVIVRYQPALPQTNSPAVSPSQPSPPSTPPARP
jgi:4-amino-4-deoxy-L-arabinose transferase-like glycosyltransferase